MIKEIKEALLTRFDKRNLCCNVPQVFEHLKSSDANFEMNSSNTMENLQLQYRHNIVAKSRAIIFVCEQIFREGTDLEKLVYTNALDHGELYKELFRDVLNFSNVEIVLNPTKAEMIEKIAQLKAEAEEFDKSHEPRKVYSFVLVHVGHKLEPTDPRQKIIIDDLGVEPKKGTDGTDY